MGLYLGLSRSHASFLCWASRFGPGLWCLCYAARCSLKCWRQAGTGSALCGCVCCGPETAAPSTRRYGRGVLLFAQGPYTSWRGLPRLCAAGVRVSPVAVCGGVCGGRPCPCVGGGLKWFLHVHVQLQRCFLMSMSRLVPMQVCVWCAVLRRNCCCAGQAPSLLCMHFDASMVEPGVGPSWLHGMMDHQHL